MSNRFERLIGRPGLHLLLAAGMLLATATTPAEGYEGAGPGESFDADTQALDPDAGSGAYGGLGAYWPRGEGDWLGLDGSSGVVCDQDCLNVEGELGWKITSSAADELGARAFYPGLLGDPNCREGDRDCNVCVPDVERQFREAKDRVDSRTRDRWHFEDWGRSFPPIGLTPYDTYDDDTDASNWLGVSSAHPQGFVRTNSTALPYAMSHSQKGVDGRGERRPGSITIIGEETSGRKRAVAVHPSFSAHPSGVASLGRFVVVGDRRSVPGGSPQDILRLIDLDRPTVEQTLGHLVRHPDWNASTCRSDPERPECPKEFGGGVAMAKLIDGTYLILSSTPGDSKDVAKFHRFYRFAGSLERPIPASGDAAAESVPFYGQWEYTPNPALGSGDFRHSENVSLLTECGTGQLYAVHSTGQGADDLIGGLIGDAYWRLSRIETHSNPVEMTVLDVIETRQDTSACHMRSAGTVSALDDGTLEFNCHQYRKDPDPSVLDVIANPFWTPGENAFQFESWTSR